MSSLENKREQEKRTVALMIRLYCKKKHGTKKELCPDCQALHDYSMLRAVKCPFMETPLMDGCGMHLRTSSPWVMRHL